jgi:glutamate mutase epsilon subunit
MSQYLFEYPSLPEMSETSIFLTDAPRIKTIQDERKTELVAPQTNSIINKLSKKNVEPFEAKINLNIPNKKVFDMLIENADEDREELIKTIAKVAVSQIEIDKLQEYLTEEVSTFINNYYNG